MEIRLPRVSEATKANLVFRAFSAFKMAGEETLGQGCRVKHDNLSSFPLKKGFRLPENKHSWQSLEVTSENALTSHVT